MGREIRAATVCAIGLVLGAAAASDVVAQAAPDRPGGFWKCRASSTVKGEFDGEDPIGLAAGKHVPTDCVIHHVAGRGKTYCFASLPSLEFLDSNPELLQQAEAFWSTTHPPPKQ